MTEHQSVPTRVAITGIGLATPLGLSAAANLARVAGDESAIGRMEAFDVEGYSCKAAAPLPPFEIASVLRFPKNEKFMTRAVGCAILAARDALAQSGVPLEAIDSKRISLYAGSGQTGIEYDEFFRALSLAWEAGREMDFKYLGGIPSRLIDPYFSLRTLSNGGAGLLSMELGTRGPSNNFVQSDTASAHALSSAYYDLIEGRCDLAIAGGYESLLTDSLYLCWEQAGLLSSLPPAEACRPFDRHRDGLVLGEGAGFLVLERWKAAEDRKAEILAELHSVSCAMETSGGWRPEWNWSTVGEVLSDARPDFVVAHGLGTVEEDGREAAAISALLGNDVPVTAFKSRTGYLGAATAAVELGLGLVCARRGWAPPIARFCCADPGVSLDLIARQPRSLSMETPRGLFLSAGLGGQVAAISASAIRH